MLRWGYSLCIAGLSLSLVVQVTSAPDVFQYGRDIRNVLRHTRQFQVGIPADFKHVYFKIKPINIMQ
jgi:hypothetical protein